MKVWARALRLVRLATESKRALHQKEIAMKIEKLIIGVLCEVAMGLLMSWIESSETPVTSQKSKPKKRRPRPKA